MLNFWYMFREFLEDYNETAYVTAYSFESCRMNDNKLIAIYNATYNLLNVRTSIVLFLSFPCSFPLFNTFVIVKVFILIL